MQHIIGRFLRILGLAIFLCAILFLGVGLYFGITEAIALDGPSQYDQIYRALKYGGVALLAGFLIRAIGGWLIRSAPPLEEVRLPVDPKL